MTALRAALLGLASVACIASAPAFAAPAPSAPPWGMCTAAGSAGGSLAAAHPAGGVQAAQWMRIADAGVSPEPGLWALLLAGFLGICAVARPRIFSS